MSGFTKFSSSKPRRHYAWTAELDSILEQGYRIGAIGRHAAIRRIQKLKGWPRQACWDRARKIGLTKKRGSVPRKWSRAEEQYLSSLLGTKNIRVIAERLRRTVGAVRTKLKRMKDSSAKVRSGHTKTEMAAFLGRSPKTIQQWIDLGWLKGYFEGKLRQDDTFRISDENFREFWQNHPEEAPLHRWSREGLEWFLAI